MLGLSLGLLLQAVVEPDPDLAARLELAKVPGVTMELVAGAPGAPSPICAGAAAQGCPAADPDYDINWGSAPKQVTPFHLPTAQAGRVLLRTARGDPLLVASGKTLRVAMDTRGDLRRWPYFNYLLHAAACKVAGQPAERFAEWKGSPMPQATTRRTAGIALALLWLLALVLWRFARMRGRARPNAAREFFSAAAGSRAIEDDPSRNWNHAGFVRPLAGFLTMLGVMFLLTGAYLGLQWLLGSKIQPFPQADGLWRTPYDMLWIVWMLFDFGTQTAFVKYFAEHRVSEPSQALADVQFYVWWQIFARLVQATLLGVTALGILPYSSYAIYAPFVALYSALHIPAITGLGKLVCQALQRFDYQNLLDMAEMRLLNFIVPIPFILLGRRWGLEHPIYGEAFGAALGLGIGQFFTQLASLGLGLAVLRALHLPLAPLLLAQFDRSTAKRQLAFGAKLTIAQEPFRLIQFLESLIIISALRDFTFWQGIRDLLSNRLQLLFQFAWTFYVGAVPAISEAFSAGKRTLTQYYVARYLQFGFLFSATLFSLMMAVGPHFIAALGPQWAAASPYLALSLLTALLLPSAWVSDALQQGAGRPWTFAIVITIEQATRLGLFLILVPKLQFLGILLGTALSLLFKAALAWTVNHKSIVPLRLAWWATLGAPALACGVNYLVWRGALALWAPTHISGTLVLLCVSSALSFFVCFFVYGLVGGYDTAVLLELRQAAHMTTLVRPICLALSRAAHLGARLAPFTPGPPSMQKEAYAQAAELDEAAARSLHGRE